MDGFEGRSSLKTWIVLILTNRAVTAGARGNRSIPFVAAVNPYDEPYEGAVDPDRFLAVDDSVFPRHWSSVPPRWRHDPEDHVLQEEVGAVVATACQALTPAQREVLILGDVAGFGSEEVCDLLRITPANQRVLLRRARTWVRRALELFHSGIP